MMAASKANMPAASDLARERSPKATTHGKKRKTSHGKHDLPSEYNEIRVFDNPGQMLIVENGELFCDACRTTVSNKKSCTDTHCRSEAHRRNLEKCLMRNTKRKSVIEKIQDMRQANTLTRGTALDDNTMADRVESTIVLMRGGHPLSSLKDNVSGFKQLLERGGSKLSYSHATELIPTIKIMEDDDCKEEIKFCGPVSIIIDGTTDVAEVIVVVLRWYNERQHVVEQRLLCCRFLRQSLTGVELAALVVDITIARYGIPPNQIIGVCCDGASVNRLAVTTLKPILTSVDDVPCFSHAGNIVGETISVPLAMKFIEKWSNMHNKSAAARLAWSSRTGSNPRRKSMVRWGTELHVGMDLVLYFPDAEAVVFAAGNHSPKLRAKLRSYMDVAAIHEYNLSKRDCLRSELALLVDVGIPIYNFVYNYEGDGVLTPFIYEGLVSLRNALEDIVLRQISCPNLRAVLREICGGEQGRFAELLGLYCARGQPALTKFNNIFVAAGGRQHAMMQVFKRFSILRPTVLHQLTPEERILHIDYLLNNVRYLASRRVELNLHQQLVMELPHLLAQPTTLVNGVEVDDEGKLRKWWSLYGTHSPHWKMLFNVAALLQPSSAGAERVFSMIRWMFGDRQEHALEDYKETSVRLRYNALWRQKLFGEDIFGPQGEE